MLRRFFKKAYWRLMGTVSDRCAIQFFYLKKFKRLPNFISPSTFNEKIQWRKLYQRDFRFHIFADKIAVKREIEKLVGATYLIETLWSGEDPRQIPFDTLSVPYVIKVNHSSGDTIFIRCGDKPDRQGIIDSLLRQLSTSHAYLLREWGYYEIPRKVLVERMVTTEEGEIPVDYKFFVYSGRVHFIQVDYARFTDHKRNLYNRELEYIDVSYCYPNTGNQEPAPPQLEEMIGVAETIGAQFDFARIDLYATRDGVKFGEITFYPGAGLEKFDPPLWDRKFGEPWIIARPAQERELPQDEPSCKILIGSERDADR